MEEKVISIKEYVLNKIEMLEEEVEIVKYVKKEYFIKLVKMLAINITTILIGVNADFETMFGKFMVLPIIITSILTFDILLTYTQKFIDINKLNKEIKKFKGRC